MEHAKKIGKILVNLLVYLVVIAGICLLPWLFRFFFPLAIGWILSILVNPIAKFMEKRLKIVRKHTSVVIIIVSLALVVLICYLALMGLFRLGAGIAREFPVIYAEIQSKLSAVTSDSNQVFSRLPVSVADTIRNAIDSIWDTLANWGKDVASSSVSAIGSAASNIPNVIVVAIFTILSAYFFIADKHRMTDWVKKIMPESTMDRYHYVMNQLKFAVGGYFKAQFKIMGVIFVIILVGFLLLRVPVGMAVVVAFLTAFLDFLPFLGTGFVLGPWAVIAFFSGDYYLVIGMAVLYIICLVAHQLLQPKLIGDSIGLEPFKTLIFMWVGYRLGGVLGMIIGIPAGMILVNLYKNGIFAGVSRTFQELVHEVQTMRKWKD